MHDLAQPPRPRLRALVATATAIVVGLLAVLLMSDVGTAQTPGGDEETYSVDVNLTRCHGEGLMDTEMQDTLIGPDKTVAEYCGSVAVPEGQADAVQPVDGTSYPTGCHGEGLPMDSAAQSNGPGSIAEYCIPDDGAADQERGRPSDRHNY